MDSVTQKFTFAAYTPKMLELICLWHNLANSEYLTLTFFGRRGEINSVYFKSVSDSYLPLFIFLKSP